MYLLCFAGIEPSCQGYRNLGLNVSYSMLVDPDGPTYSNDEEDETDPPFVAHCEMWLRKFVGITMVKPVKEQDRIDYDVRDPSHCSSVYEFVN